MVLEDLAAEMCPAGNFADPVPLVELVVTGIAVGLKQTGEGLELALRMNAASIGGEPVPDQGRSSRARGAIIDDIGPQPGLRGLALAGHQHRHRRIIGVQLAGLQAFFADTGDDRIEQRSGLACPTGEGRAVDIDPLRRHHLGLAVERQVVIELVHDHMGKRGKAGLAARNRLHRGPCLDDLLAGPAGILGANGADDAPLHRRHIEHLVAVLPKRPKRAAAIRAGTAAGFGFDAAFDARQMRREAADRCIAHGPGRHVFAGLDELGFALQFLERQLELFYLAA